MIVFEKPHALTDTVLHYCPGCTHGIVHRLVAEAIDELKEKAKQCKTMEELTALAAKEGIELPDEVVDQIAGGCGPTCIHTPACPGFR